MDDFPLKYWTVDECEPKYWLGDDEWLIKYGELTGRDVWTCERNGDYMYCLMPPNSLVSDTPRMWCGYIRIAAKKLYAQV
jgi:hypothetical protein